MPTSFDKGSKLSKVIIHRKVNFNEIQQLAQEN